MTRIAQIQQALGQVPGGIDGWLFYDFRVSDPIAYRVLGLDERGISTRRWFCLVPSAGEPRKLVSAVEPRRLDSAPGSTTIYRSAGELHAGLARMLEGTNRIAMDYSPNGAIPYVSRVDAGTADLVRALGKEIVTAANLIQRLEATLTAGQLQSHRRAAAKLRTIVDETFAEVAHGILSGTAASDHAIQQFVMERFAAHRLVTAEPPIVAINAHTADPHFAPSAENPAPIRRGDFLLLDLWAKEGAADSIYADLTWVGYADTKVPDEHAKIFAIVARARDATVALIERHVAAAEPVTGRDADRAARQVIEDAGFGECFLHRTGHSIGREVHGNGANLDSLETDDSRLLLDHTCFSVEPGIYLERRFGIRSELDMTIENGRARVSADTVQSAIIPILSRFADYQLLTGRPRG